VCYVSKYIQLQDFSFPAESSYNTVDYLLPIDYSLIASTAVN